MRLINGLTSLSIVAETMLRMSHNQMCSALCKTLVFSSSRSSKTFLLGFESHKICWWMKEPNEFTKFDVDYHTYYRHIRYSSYNNREWSCALCVMNAMLFLRQVITMILQSTKESILSTFPLINFSGRKWFGFTSGKFLLSKQDDKASNLAV